MTSPRCWDVAIVGSGPAGSAAAIAALHAEPSAAVLLLDRSEFPRDKCCGDAVLADAVQELEGHGVSGATLMRGFEPTRQMTLTTPGGRTVVGRLPTEMTVIPRVVFDARLLAAARAAGAVWRRQRVRAVSDRGDHVEIDGRLRARVVIGADGAESVVRRGVTRSASCEMAVALRGYDPAGGAGDPAMVFQNRGGLSYAWRFPTTGGLTNVGYGHLLRPGQHASRTELLATMHRLLPDARPAPPSLRASRLPLATSRQRPAHGRILLAGDAAALVNPLSGEGIYYAIASGLAAGRAAVGPPAASAIRYRHALQRRFGRHQNHVVLLSMLAALPPILEAGILAAETHPGVFADLADLGLGDGRLTGRLVLGLARQLIGSGVRG